MSTSTTTSSSPSSTASTTELKPTDGWLFLPGGKSPQQDLSDVYTIPRASFMHLFKCTLAGGIVGGIVCGLSRNLYNGCPIVRAQWLHDVEGRPGWHLAAIINKPADGLVDLYYFHSDRLGLLAKTGGILPSVGWKGHTVTNVPLMALHPDDISPSQVLEACRYLTFKSFESILKNHPTIDMDSAILLFENSDPAMTLDDYALSKMRTAEGYRIQFEEFYRAASSQTENLHR